MNVPDDFVFVCEDDGEEVIASHVVRIVTHYYHTNPYIASYLALHCSEDLSIFPTLIFMDHGHDNGTQFKKGTKEFNELIELCYMKQVLR